MPVEDEVERALASMRTGFLSGSATIAAGLASLREHLADAPVEEREAARAATTQIVNAQARLNARVEALPAPSWEQFTAMVSVLKAQQTVRDQLEQLVEQYVPATQPEDVEGAPDSTGSSLPRVLTPTPKDEGLLVAREALEVLRVQNARQARDVRRTRRTRRTRVEDDEPRSRGWTSGFRGVAAMVVAAVVLSSIPRDVKLQDLATKIVALVGSGTETVTSGAPNPTAAPEVVSPSLTAGPERQSADAKAPLPDDGAATDRPHSSVTASSADQKRATAPAPVPQDAGAVTEPTAPPPNVPQERFVPVVFTHKDYATVMQALADLKERYPSLLSDRKGAVQPVDLGKKGIWHRLVLLPAGPRPVASKLCDQLLTEGYDRCWVKSLLD